MATDSRPELDPAGVRSHARGRRFLTMLIAPWVLGVIVGAALALALGFGLAAGIGSGLAVALGLNFVWVVIMFAKDDGAADDRVRTALGEDEAAGRPAR
jgi:hypothetical protein